MKAVDAWRNRGAASTPIAAGASGSKVGSSGNVTTKGPMGGSGGGGGASAAALAMAAKIATELEVEQQVFRKRMSEQKEVLQASIKQNEEMSLKLQGDVVPSEEKSSVRDRGEQSEKRSHQPNMLVSVQVDDEDDDEGDFDDSKQVNRAPVERVCSPKQSPSDADTRGNLLYRVMGMITFDL